MFDRALDMPLEMRQRDVRQNCVKVIGTFESEDPLHSNTSLHLMLTESDYHQQLDHVEGKFVLQVRIAPLSLPKCLLFR